MLECCRFVNADILYDGNLYAYCHSSPIKYCDDNGYAMYTAFEDCGFGNPMIGLGACSGGGGWSVYVYAGVNQGAADDDGRSRKWYEERERHYARNNEAPVFPKTYDDEFFTGWSDDVPANCHQFTSENRSNRKYTNGMYEAIYDEFDRLVTHPSDVGTTNLCDPTTDGFGHFVEDVWPWIKWGNSIDDPTNWIERVFSFMGIYFRVIE